MPKRPRITVVPVEQEVVSSSEGPGEPKTDAEQMTEIIAEATASVEPEPVLEEAPVPKAKAKRAPSRNPSARKPKGANPEVEVTQSVDETQVEATSPVEEASAVAKVECLDCGKLMSQKTLRYSHGLNCVVKKQQQAATQSEANVIVEQDTRSRLQTRREERAARRDSMVAKLVQNAF